MINIYAIFDTAIQSFGGNPFYQRTNAAAVRDVKGAMEQQDHPFAKNPEDFELHKLGTYNEETGEIAPAKELVIRLKDIPSNSQS